MTRRFLLAAVLPLWLAGAGEAQTAPARAGRQPAIPSHTQLRFPPLKPIQIPPVEQYTLPNGMKVYLLEDHELPLVSGTALVRTGNLFDPPEKVGLATMTGMVLRTGGTQARTGDEIDVQLENIAAAVESDIGETSGRVSFSALKENTDEVMGVFRDLLTAPEFRQEKIDLAKNELRSSIARRNDSPSGIASREFANLVYGRDNPYGWTMEYEHLGRIQRDDLVAFYRRYFFPANIMLAVYGDFSTAEMKARIEKLFGGWSYQQPAVPPFPKVPGKPEPGVFLGEKPDVTQTFFEVGHLGGTFRDKDYPALEVMGDILGGGFRSRLFQRVRTQMGIAYSISAYWGANYGHPGLFRAGGSTNSASTAAAIRAVREEIERIRSAPVSAEELKAAKDSVLNSFVFNFDTKSKTLNRLLRYEYFGYPRDFIFQYQKAIEGVTGEDVLRVAKEHLKPERLTIVAVGNPKDFGQPLSSLGLPVNKLDLTIPEPRQESAQADTASLERGRQLLQRVQQALGGAERLAGIRDLTTVSELTMARGGMKARNTNRWVAPEHLRQDSQLPFGKMAVYSDGKTGWIVSPQGAGPLPPPLMQQVRGELFRIYPRLMTSDRIPGRTVNHAGPGLLEISGEGMTVKLYVDEKTGMPVKEAYSSPGMGGAPSQVEEIYGEFREVDGVKAPFRITVMQNGQKFAEANISEYKFNSGLTVEEVSKRP
ncbi:MAG: insulinase family protein [Bryobacterales bacterium]|nr:insulinase family protein [Bryobacterales bacterium]